MWTFRLSDCRIQVATKWAQQGEKCHRVNITQWFLIVRILKWSGLEVLLYTCSNTVLVPYSARADLEEKHSGKAVLKRLLVRRPTLSICSPTLRFQSVLFIQCCPLQPCTLVIQHFLKGCMAIVSGIFFLGNYTHPANYTALFMAYVFVMVLKFYVLFSLSKILKVVLSANIYMNIIGI